MASFLQKVFNTLSVTNTIEGEQRQRERVYLLQNLKTSSKRVLSNSSVGKNAGRIKSSDPFAEALCNDILACVSHGMRPKVKGGIWALANKCCKRILSRPKQVHNVSTAMTAEEAFLDSVQAISMLDFVKTPQGKGRAWIRQALNIKAMADIITIILKDETLIAYCYEDYSLLRCQKGSQLLISMLAPLGIFDFCFDVDLALFDHQNFPSLPAEIFRGQDPNDKIVKMGASRRTKNAVKDKQTTDTEIALRNKLWQPHTSEEQNKAQRQDDTNALASSPFFATMSMISKVAKNTAISITKDASSALDLVIDGFASRKRLQQACGFEVSLSTLLRSPFHCRYARLEPRLGSPRLLEQCLQSLEANGGLDTPNLFHISPNEADVLAMKEAYGAGQRIPTGLFSSHATGGLLLSFLMNIPGGLVPKDHQPPLVMCATQIDDVNARNRNVSFRLQELPWENRPTLLLLIHFFRKLSDVDHSVNNGLGIKKTSILFSKILFGAKFDDDDLGINSENQDILEAHASHSIKDNYKEGHRVRRSISDIMASKACSESHIETAEVILSGGEEVIRELVRSQEGFKAQLKMKIDFLRMQYDNQFKPFSNQNSQHVAYLKRMWKVLFPLVVTDDESKENHSEFSLFSGIWSRLGFRGSDPTVDLRGGGVFALEHLVYFCDNYSEYFVQCLLWQSETNTRTPLDAYPIVVTFARISRIVSEIIRLRVGSMEDRGGKGNVTFSIKTISLGPCWQLLDSGASAIGELCTFAFVLFHKNWNRERSHFVDYENSLEILKRQLNDSVLNKYPVNAAELWDLGVGFVGKIKNNTKGVTGASDDILGNIKESHSVMSSTVPKVNVDREDLQLARQRLPTLRGNEPGSPLLTESYILTLKHVSYISNSLPLQYREYSWVCSYSLVRDGKSYATLYKKIKGHIGSLLIIKDSSGHIFGGFARQPWSMKQEGYYGTGETFVFSLEPKVDVFKWSEKNSFFMMLNENAIAMGGGGSFAIYLDSDLHEGTSGQCETFDSPPLSSPSENSDEILDVRTFTCVDLEIWTFK